MLFVVIIVITVPAFVLQFGSVTDELLSSNLNQDKPHNQPYRQIKNTEQAKEPEGLQKG